MDNGNQQSITAANNEQQERLLDGNQVENGDGNIPNAGHAHAERFYSFMEKENYRNKYIEDSTTINAEDGPESTVVETNYEDNDEEVEVFGDEGEIAVVSKHGIPLDSTSITEDSRSAHRSSILGSIRSLTRQRSVQTVDGKSGKPEQDLETLPEESEESKKKHLSELGKHAIGLLFIIMHCLSVVASTQTAKATYSKDFSAPFFLVYFRSAWRIAVFPLFMIIKYSWTHLFCRHRKMQPVSFTAMFLQCETVFGPRGLTVRSFFYPTGVLAVIWISVQFTLVLAVKYLNNSIVQALFCSETAICYVLSVIFLKIPVYAVKVLAVMIALAGVSFMGYSQTKDDLRWEGITICVIGALLGSVYMVAFKRLIGKSEDVGKALLMTSAMAVFITLTAWPIVIIMQVTGVEYWNWETFPWTMVCISSTLTLISISLFNLCLTLTSPFLMTLSKLLGIPANYLVDALFWSHVFDAYQIVGCVLIGVGFVFIALPERWVSLLRITNSCKRARAKSLGASTGNNLELKQPVV